MEKAPHHKKCKGRTSLYIRWPFQVHVRGTQHQCYGQTLQGFWFRSPWWECRHIPHRFAPKQYNRHHQDSPLDYREEPSTRNSGLKGKINQAKRANTHCNPAMKSLNTSPFRCAAGGKTQSQEPSGKASRKGPFRKKLVGGRNTPSPTNSTPHGRVVAMPVSLVQGSRQERQNPLPMRFPHARGTAKEIGLPLFETAIPETTLIHSTAIQAAQ